MSSVFNDAELDPQLIWTVVPRNIGLMLTSVRRQAVAKLGYMASGVTCHNSDVSDAWRHVSEQKDSNLDF